MSLKLHSAISLYYNSTIAPLCNNFFVFSRNFSLFAQKFQNFLRFFHHSVSLFCARGPAFPSGRGGRCFSTRSSSPIDRLFDRPTVHRVVGRVEGDAAAIDVSVVLARGYKMKKVCSQIQEKVKSAVQSMTGVTVSKVNVSVVDVDFPVGSAEENS